MASHSTLIYNPTNAAVTVDSNTVQSGNAATFSLSDATTDAYLWVDAGCVLTKPGGTKGTARSSGTVECWVCAFSSVPGSR